jgi:predicted Rdx family selenoprotein
MVDPITALAAISSAVELVKKVAATVDDVTSLGPVLGKYFDAKADAIEVVQKSQEGGFKGSALGKALELEMAIEQAKQFEEQIKMLFFQANKMDVWVRIAARAQRMEADAAHAARRKKEAQKKHEQEMEELFVVVIGIVVVFVTVGATVWFIMEATVQGAK